MLLSPVSSGPPEKVGRRVARKLLLLSVAAPLLLLLGGGSSTQAHQSRFSEEIARTVMTRWKDSWERQPGRTEKWSYDQGVVLKGLEGLLLNTVTAIISGLFRRASTALL